MTVLSPDDIRNLLIVEVSPGQSKSVQPWAFDQTEIAKVVRELGLRHLVKIRFSDGEYLLGTHRAPKPDKPWHRIAVSNLRSARESNVTVWHEFAHAFQSEDWARRTGNPIEKFYTSIGYNSKQAKGPHGASYEQNVYEIHAREFAEANSRQRAPLVKRVQPGTSAF